MSTYDRFISRAGVAMRESAIRQMGTVLAQAKDMISFAPGYPAEDAFPWAAFADMAASLFDGSDGSVLQYGPTRGFKPLREACAALMTSRGISSVAERIVITTGSQQGLDLVARVLVDPGDVVLMELPSYTGAITAFRNVGASLVGVRQDDHGVELDHLDDTWQRANSSGHAVKFLYLVPNFQNPTGRLLSLERRRAILEWAERRDVLIVEDDPYRDLYFPDVTAEHETRPIAADDRDGARVIYLSSFSKTLAPGFRVGWMSAPGPGRPATWLIDELLVGGMQKVAARTAVCVPGAPWRTIGSRKHSRRFTVQVWFATQLAQLPDGGGLQSVVAVQPRKVSMLQRLSFGAA